MALPDIAIVEYVTLYNKTTDIDGESSYSNGVADSIGFCGSGTALIYTDDDVWWLVAKDIKEIAPDTSAYSPVLYKSINGGSTWSQVGYVSTNTFGAGPWSDESDNNLKYNNISMVFDASANLLHFVWTNSGHASYSPDKYVRHRSYNTLTGVWSDITTFSSQQIKPPAVIASNAGGQVLLVVTSTGATPSIYYAKYQNSAWSSLTEVAGSSEASGPLIVSVAYCSINDKYYILVTKNSTTAESDLWSHDFSVDGWTKETTNKPFIGLNARPSSPVYYANTIALRADANGNLHAVQRHHVSGMTLRAYYSQFNGTSWLASEQYALSFTNLKARPSLGIDSAGNVILGWANGSFGEIYSRSGVNSYVYEGAFAITTSTVISSPVEIGEIAPPANVETEELPIPITADRPRLCAVVRQFSPSLLFEVSADDTYALKLRYLTTNHGRSADGTTENATITTISELPDMLIEFHDLVYLKTVEMIASDLANLFNKDGSSKYPGANQVAQTFRTRYEASVVKARAWLSSQATEITEPTSILTDAMLRMKQFGRKSAEISTPKVSG